MVERFYKVVCKCGHTGNRKTYILISFPLIAKNAKDAALKARWIPRCKHHHKDCIRSVEEISYDQYINLCNFNRKDPYLFCSSIQEQKLYNIENRFIEEEFEIVVPKERDSCSRKKIFIGKQTVKNPKRFCRLYTF